MIPEPKTRTSIIRWLIRGLVACAALILAFVLGTHFERFAHGRWYQVRDETSYTSDLGTLQLKHVTETQGVPFLDPGDTVITLNNDITGPITLYRAKRLFQEETPWVDKLSVKGNEVRWTDGLYQFTTRIDPLPPTTTSATTAATTQP